MSLDRKILDRIEKDKIKIIPRWVFALKDIFSWLYAGTLLVASSFALAMATFIVRSAGLASFNAALSYVWLAIFAGFFVWGYRKLVQAGFAHMYKLSFAVLVPVAFVANMVFGYGFYEGGQVSKVETKLEEMPVYKNFLPFEKISIENEEVTLKEEKNDSGEKDSDNQESDQVLEDQKRTDETLEQVQQDDVEAQEEKSDNDTSENENINTEKTTKAVPASISKPKSKDEDKSNKINDGIKEDNIDEAKEDIINSVNKGDDTKAVDGDEEDDAQVKGVETSNDTEQTKEIGSIDSDSSEKVGTASADN